MNRIWTYAEAVSMHCSTKPFRTGIKYKGVMQSKNYRHTRKTLSIAIRSSCCLVTTHPSEFSLLIYNYTHESHFGCN